MLRRLLHLPVAAEVVVLLADHPPDGLVVGVIGRFWRLHGSLVEFEPAEFAPFDQPGYAKVAWSFEVLSHVSGSRPTTETRVSCTDDAARRRFRHYWRLVGPFSGMIRARMLHLAKDAAEHGARS